MKKLLNSQEYLLIHSEVPPSIINQINLSIVQKKIPLNYRVREVNLLTIAFVSEKFGCAKELHFGNLLSGSQLFQVVEQVCASTSPIIYIKCLQ